MAPPIWLGSLALGALANLLASTELAPSWFGSAARFAGRVDDDERVDLIVYEGSGWDAGRSWVLSGRDRSVLYRFAGVEGEWHLSRVDRAGDVDGDGREDLLVGWRAWDDDLWSPGGEWEVRSGASGERLLCFEATSVSSVADLDGDGTRDFLVRVIDHERGKEELGSHRLVSGRSGELLHEFRASSAPGHLGSTSSVVGDVDGDGSPDIVGTRRIGEAVHELVVLSPRRSEPVLRVRLSSNKERARFYICDAGDHDGDGHDDLGVGETLDERRWHGERETFRVYSGKDGAVLLEITDSVTGSDGSPHSEPPGFGSVIRRLDDLDGDGVSDFLLGAESYQLWSGAFLLVSGQSGEVLALETAPDDPRSSTHFASGLDSGEDWDADGTPDWLVTSGSATGGRGTGAVCIYSGATRELLEQITRSSIRE